MSTFLHSRYYWNCWWCLGVKKLPILTISMTGCLELLVRGWVSTHRVYTPNCWWMVSYCTSVKLTASGNPWKMDGTGRWSLLSLFLGVITPVVTGRGPPCALPYNRGESTSNWDFPITQLPSPIWFNKDLLYLKVRYPLNNMPSPKRKGLSFQTSSF